MKKFNKNRIILFFNSITVRLLIYLLFTLIVSTLLVYVIEKSDGKITNIFEALWFSFISLTTVGYGDITPSTITGKIISIFTITAGVALVALATGQLASILIEAQMQRGKGLMKLKNIKNHIIICGWKNDFISILYDIIDFNENIYPEDIVLVNNENAETMQTLLADPKILKINYIHGDYADEKILQRAKISNASKLIVLADDTGRYSPSEVDSKTVMTVLTVESINKNLYISAELFDSKFEKYLSRSHCDEIILIKDFSKKLVVNSVAANGFTHVIEEFINPKKNVALTTIDIPQTFINKPYIELFNHFFDKGIVTIGLLENTGNFYQRKKEAIKEAQKTPDISKLVVNLQDIKSMRGNEPLLNPDKDYVISPYTNAIVLNKIKPKEVING